MQVGWTPSPSRWCPVRVRALYLPRSAASTPLWTSWEKSLTCTSQMTSSGAAGGGRILRPAVGVGAAQVDDHAAPAVQPAGPGPGVGGAAHDPLAVGDGKVVVAAVQVAFRRGLPDAALAADKVDAQAGARPPFRLRRGGGRPGGRWGPTGQSGWPRGSRGRPGGASVWYCASKALESYILRRAVAEAAVCVAVCMERTVLID